VSLILNIHDLHVRRVDSEFSLFNSIRVHAYDKMTSL
jgi:hypothetical protein